MRDSDHMEFDIGRFTRKCAATERELQPGDAFYSVLIPAGAEVERKDYLASAWPGAPDDAICWWKSEMPSADARRVTWAPSDAILEYFSQLLERGDSPDQLYVLALWMIRRRIVRWDETRSNDQGAETMFLFCAANDTEYQVPIVEPRAERIIEIEQELARLLFTAAE